MSKPADLPRPPQMTLVGWMIIIGSIFVVFGVFDVLGNLRSLETREMVEGYLNEPPGDTLGWSVATGLEALRITAMVTAVCAASAVVLGWFVLQRNAGARLALSVLAVPLFVTGMITGGFVSSMVAAGVVLLWMQPARSWFKGETPPAPVPLGRDDRGARAWGQKPHDPSAPHATADAPRATASVSVGSPESTDARPVQGFGDQPTWQAPVNPYGLPVADSSPNKRPGAALLAAILTWVFAGFSLVSGLASLFLLQTDPDALLGDAEEMVARLEEQSGSSGQLTAESLIASMNVVGGMLIVFSLAACIAAFLLLRRRPQGAVVLMIVAAMSAGFCLLGALVVPPLALPGLASLAVVLLLRRRAVRAWLRAA